jgi:hypothetical protein
LLGAAFPDRLQDFCNSLATWLGAEIAFAVDADADGVRFHVAFSNHKHGVDFHLLSPLDFHGIRDKLILRTHGSLAHYNFMADGNPILAALELKAPCANYLCSFRVSDTVLTAAMLAGGTDPIHNLMDSFRKFMKAPSAGGKDTME